MLLHLRRSLVALAVLTVICGLIYPLVETGLAQWWFPHQANGSIGADGSTLIGQHWSGPEWFHGRPDPDDPSLSGASNLGPTSKALRQAVASALRSERALGVSDPPADLVTGSGSGLDPDISPAAALAQVDQVARARHLPRQLVRELVLDHSQGPELGFLGAPTVDVLELNQALARLAAGR